MPRPYKLRELIQSLKQYDDRFQVLDRRGKGSHRMIYHPNVNGRAVSYPVKCHGLGTELSKGVIGDIIRHFGIPPGVL